MITTLDVLCVGGHALAAPYALSKSSFSVMISTYVLHTLFYAMLTLQAYVSNVALTGNQVISDFMLTMIIVMVIGQSLARILSVFTYIFQETKSVNQKVNRLSALQFER